MDPSSAAAIASHSGELFEESGADDIVRREPRAAPQGSSSQRRALDVADDMVLEYIAFRGFTETFRSFSLARADDRANRGSFDARFAVDALLRPARDLDALGLLDAWDFLEARFFGNLDAELAAHVGGLRCGVYRLFCVTAVRDGQRHSATALLAELARATPRTRGAATGARCRPGDDGGDRALWFLDDGDDGAGAAADARGGAADARNGSRWREWFAMPHLPEPHKDPLFAVYFTQKWRDAFVGSLRNFLATVFARARVELKVSLTSIAAGSAASCARSSMFRAMRASSACAAHAVAATLGFFAAAARGHAAAEAPPPRRRAMASADRGARSDWGASDDLDTLFKLVVLPGQESVLTLHVALPCYDQLLQHGGAECLETTYSGMVSQPEPGYSVALSANADETSSPEDLLSKLVLVKRNLMGAPFQKAFSSLAAGTAKDLPRRAAPLAQERAMPSNWDRVTIVFSVDFPEESDRAYCRIFLQQLQDVGRKTPAKLAKTIDNLIGFRNYLHFHIKAAKTNLHMRMRRKVNSWIQIVNRAIMTADKPKDMKTSSRKTFTRK
ncbi:hypothetical protein JL722_10585 [Aureococcus anophagefferens]|nr:hypothetical protein JL722_10585 [Aureococcus anophagefferens]